MAAKYTYIIKYQVLNSINTIIKAGKIKCKNKDSDIAAKVGLESFLQKTVIGFHRLVIIECTKDFNIDNIFGGDLFNNGFDSFSNIFKGFKK